jgi:alginate O-acetyltransferase complex protein AlgI
MVFSSSIFLFLFLPLVIGGYFLSPGIKAKNIFLLIVSVFFYTYGEIHYVVVLLISILCNTWFAKRIESNKTHARGFLVGAVVTNLFLLAYFKYANFAVENINIVFAVTGLGEIENRPVHLPLGISFFTFQALSYVIDVYRGTSRAQKSSLNVALYISFFPQLIAGPIVRYGDIARQLNERSSTSDDIAYGVRRFIIGLGKKVLIANVVGQTADEIFAHDSGQLDIAMVWLGILCYSLQIYFDFSGYSDMAIGLGRIFGFRFPENFRDPYISTSVQEFWQRWHISLSRWFRDYLYIPLGGNRKGAARTYFNLLLVFILCGLWHGASWSFLAWGVFHGTFLVLERTRFAAVLMRLPVFFRHVYLLLVVSVGWVFFRAENLAYALDYLQVMFGFGLREYDGYVLFFLDTKLIIALCLGSITSMLQMNAIWGKYFTISEQDGNDRKLALYLISEIALLILFGLSVVYISAQSYNPFIYFRF